MGITIHSVMQIFPLLYYQMNQSEQAIEAKVTKCQQVLSYVSSILTSIQSILPKLFSGPSITQ